MDPDVKAALGTGYNQTKKLLKWTIALAIVFLAALAITAFLKERRSKNAAAKKQEREWQHYTGWRLDGDMNDSGVRLEIGVLRDKKTGVLCATSGYPGYPACPPQEYVVNGQPTPAPKVAPEQTP
jgi:hypothetical protein